MANYSNLKAAINAVIKQNGQGEITGEVMNQVLTAMVNSLGSNYLFAGVATPSTNPGTPDQNVFYMATQAGTYTNFNAIVLQAGISILLWNGSWSSETFFEIDSVPTSGSGNFISSGAVFDKFKLDGGAYDVSAHNNNQTFASLSALLNDANLSTLIPTNIRSGGMSIKFIQSSDNKYVQYRLMATSWGTTESDWQGVDDEPTAGSNNLVKSGGVANSLQNSLLKSEVTNYNIIKGYYLSSSGQITQGTQNYRICKLHINDGNYYLKAPNPSSSRTLFKYADDTFSPEGAQQIIGQEGDIYREIHLEAGYYVISWHSNIVDVKDYETYLINSLFIADNVSINEQETTFVPIKFLAKYNDSNKVNKNAGENIFDDIDPDIMEGYYIDLQNIIRQNSSYLVSGYIPVKANTTYYPVKFGTCRFVTLYDKYKKHITGGYENVTQFTTPASIGYVRITIPILQYKQLSEISAEAVEYSPVYNYLAKTKDNAVDYSKLSEQVKETIASKNIFTREDCLIGKYWSNVEYTNSDYNCTKPIEVTPGESYVLSKNGVALDYRFVSYLVNADDTSSASYEQNNSLITVPQNCHYIRLSIPTLYWDNLLQVELGTNPTTYEPHFDTYQQIKIRDKQITREKIADNVLYDPDFRRIIISNGTLTPNNSLAFSNIRISKGINLSAVIDGEIDSVLVGVGYLNYYGRWLEITANNVIGHSGVSGDVFITRAHGLTLGQQTKIIIDRELSNATVTLIADDGEIFRDTFTWSGNIGNFFVRNNNTSGNIAAELSFVPKDINKDIWLFGDSYCGYTDPARWLTYLFNYQYTSILLNAIGGENSTGALADFKSIINLGALPRYIVWALGMNDTPDTTSPNSTWLENTMEFINICKMKSITPILCTIPTVPNRNHSYKSEWVRMSGCRYIDMAKAVEQEGTLYWKNWGTEKAMLYTDEVHPTTYGARALAGAVLTEFPEITRN